jgi:hypothetical protein
MKQLPDHAPLIAADLICYTCGEKMSMEVSMSRQGVSHITYTCKNKDTGCSYKVESLIYSGLQPMLLRNDG